jgi:O-antigen ligase
LWSGALRLGAWRLRWSLISITLVALAIALAASVPWALFYSGPMIAAASLARAGLFAIGIYLFLDVAYGPGRAIEAARLLRWIFWAGAASALFAVLDFLLQLPAPARFAEQFVWLSSGVFRRAQGVFYDASTLGCLCAFLLVMVAAANVTGVQAKLGIRHAWLWSAAAVLVAALIFSFSRAAIANVIVSLAALALLERRRLGLRARSLRLPLAAAASIAAGLALAAAFFPEFLAAYGMKLIHSAEFFISEPNMVLSRRLDSWSALAAYVEQNPWASALGIGYKTLPYTEHLGSPVVADNMYLSLLIETGWPGLAALLAASLAILLQTFREARYARSAVRRFCGAWMFAFWCGEMAQMMTGDILTYWRILPAFLAVLAIGARDDDPDPRPVL